MNTKESYRDRQENELEVLKSIFGNDVKDQRAKQEKWLPLDIRIELKPFADSQIQDAYCQLTLHLLCPRNYPKAPPKIAIENSKGLKDCDVVQLLNQLNKEAYSLKGEVMIFELCQIIQAFLHEHNKPPKGSFYDEMLANKQKRDQDKMTQQKQKEEKIRQALQDEVLKRKEQLLKETRIRRSTLSESSPMRHLSSNSSESDNKNLFDLCEEHRRSEAFYCPQSGRKFQLGACISHSQKGCVSYSGIDLNTGQLVYITEWTFKYFQLDARNIQADSVIETIEQKVMNLSKLRHKHLIGYEAVLCSRKKDQLVVFLVQEFLLGISIFSISGGLGWCSEGASMVAKGVLEALIFLHNNGVSHGNLVDSTVFMDTSGVIRVTDYSLIPYLQELVNGEQASPDLPSLGTLIESLIPTPHLEMRDFINRCKSERTLSASDLMDHPFLFPLLTDPNSQTPDDQNIVALNIPPPIGERVQPNINLPVPFMAPLVQSNHSRLHTEFETINFIGRGAYGDVLKVRNILDNRQYAIKRIPLSSRNKQLYKKMTREVELLSRLNHENVVRYYNSWIETETASIRESEHEEDDDEYSVDQKKSAMVKTHSRNQLTAPPSAEDSSSDEDSFSPGWNNFIGNHGIDDSDSDGGIQFLDSRGNEVKYDEDDEEESSASVKQKRNGAGDGLVMKKVVLYIQMEFCEKSTLRTAIDANLYQDKERVWKLFREIVEGLSHIHQQGMIHRDLKPVNIFLDSRDHVKIGDFGLATTSVLALQNQSQEAANALMTPQMSFGDSQTGQVGTALYCAPELSGKASKSTYNQKVDLYSLGIIFFEMCTTPLTTGMERIKTIAALRTPEVILPQTMLEDEKCQNEVKLLRWLLDHNPAQRPTSEELLQSELVPPARLEANELQEMLRHVLANPQSRAYKHLIARCLAQESNTVGELTYHLGMVPVSSLFENVKNKIIQVLRNHGAIDVSTPLLTPYTKANSIETTVRLMTHSGSVVTLPTDLRQPFLRYVATNGVTCLRRYSIGRVWHEKKVFNFHPKQNFECAFDIVSPNRGHFLVDAELLAVADEIIREFATLNEKNITFRINHTSLLRAIFLYYSVPKDKYQCLLALVSDYLDGKLSRFQVQSSVQSLLQNPQMVNSLVDLLLITDCSIKNVNSSLLKILIKGRGEATALAKGAIRELEAVINLSQAMGVHLPINLCIGLSMGYDCNRPGSIMWQMIGELKADKQTTIACGGRYDTILEDLQRTAQRAGVGIFSREAYCAGFSLAMDKLLYCLTQSHEITCRAGVDLVVFVTGSRPPLKETTHLMRSLWNAGIKCCFIETPNPKDDDDLYAKELGANHTILLGEDGCLRVKTWQVDHYSEKSVTRAEIIEYLKKNLNADLKEAAEHPNNLARNNSVSSVSTKIYEAITSGLPSLDTIFLTNEKVTQNKKKRIENQIEQKLSNVRAKFGRKESLVIFAVDLEMKQIKSLISCIDPNPKDHSQSEFEAILEKFPKHKKYMQEIYDDIMDRLIDKRNCSIVGIFSIIDSYLSISINRLIL